MDNETRWGEVCSVCQKSVQGGFTVRESEPENGELFVILVEGTPDRDFNDCDLCNVRVHFRCSRHPASGYCDRCYEKVFRDAGSVGLSEKP